MTDAAEGTASIWGALESCQTNPNPLVLSLYLLYVHIWIHVFDHSVRVLNNSEWFHWLKDTW